MTPSKRDRTVIPLREEYADRAAMLRASGIVTPLCGPERLGTIGGDGREFPLPALEQVEELFRCNDELVREKHAQGFDRLELTPMAMPLPALIGRLRATVLKRSAEGGIFQTRSSSTDALVPVRVNSEKQVWVWDTLRHAFEAGDLVYFPKELSDDHQGMTKGEAIDDESICAFPGWSIGLTESIPFMSKPGQVTITGGRERLEAGLSPNEYISALKNGPYRGETGNTLEDFLVRSICRLEATGEVSNDVSDDNALWCLGQYLRISYAQVVPTGRWHRSIGRFRLDMHRTNNKQCTKSFGATTVVRLSGG
ncbi:MAG: hypothetical protein LUQ09_01535 [Methanomassiliicoccales archaeon]|nr:hypothetical protein [Methanomassiliicoccales archaeon]